MRDGRLYPKRGWWHVVFYDPVTRKKTWHALGTRSKREAVKRRRTFERPEEEWRPATNLHEAFDLYLDSRRRRCRPSSIRDITYFGNLVKKIEDKPMADVTEQDWETVLGRKITPATEAGYYRRIMAFQRWVAMELGETAGETPRHPKPERRVAAWLSRGEWRDLKRHLTDPALYQVSAFALATGMRQGEILSLRWDDIKDDWIRVQGKGGHWRHVPVFPAAREVLDSISPLGETLFTMTSFQVSHGFKAAVRAAKLSEAYRFHTLRHTFASWLAQEGIPMGQIRDWMGHSTITVTEIYAHLQVGHMAPKAASVFTKL